MITVEYHRKIDDTKNIKGLFGFSTKLNQNPEMLRQIFALPRLYSLILDGAESYADIPDNIKHNSDLHEVRFINFRLRIPSVLVENPAIEAVHISNSKLKELPAELENLPNLKSLWLSSSPVNGKIWETILNLKNLEKLIIFDSKQKNIPAGIAKLSKLKHISFAHHKIKELPSELFELSELEIFSVDTGNIEAIPDGICKLKKLTILSLFKNKIKGIPDSLFELNSIQKLFLGSNPIKTLSPKIGKLQQLEWLSLNNTEIEHFPVELGNLKNLKELSFGCKNQVQMPWVVAISPILEKIDPPKNYISKTAQKYFFDFREWLNKQQFSLAERKTYAAIWGRVDEYAKEASVEELVSGLLSKIPILNTNSLYYLCHHSTQAYKKKSLGEGKELVACSKIDFKAKELRDKLRTAGANYSGKLSEKTTHIVLNERCKTSKETLLSKPFIFLTEQQLAEQLDQIAPDYLVEESATKTQSIEQLKALVWTATEDNFKLFLELLKGGGIPKELVTELMGVWKLATESKTRSKAKKLLNKIASPELLTAMKNRFSFHNHASDDWTYRRGITPYENTEIDVSLFTKLYYLLQKKIHKNNCVGYLLEKGNSIQRLDFIEKYLIKNNAIIIEGHFGLRRMLKEFFAFPQVRQIEIKMIHGWKEPARMVSDEEMFPAEMSKAINLESYKVQIPNYKLSSVPEVLMTLPKLVKLGCAYSNEKIKSTIRNHLYNNRSKNQQ